MNIHTLVVIDVTYWDFYEFFSFYFKLNIEKKNFLLKYYYNNLTFSCIMR